MNTDNRVLFFGALAVLGAVLAGSQFGLLSIYDTTTPKMDDCPPDYDTGDIRCTADNNGDTTIERSPFDVRINDISGSSHTPVDRFLYLQGLVKDSAPDDEGYERDGSGFSIDRYLRFNDDIRERVERGSTCRVRISDLTADNPTNFDVNGEDFRWEDDDDQDDRAPSIVNLDFEPFWVEGDVVVQDRHPYVKCANIDYVDVIKKADDRVDASDDVSVGRIPHTEAPGLELEVDFGIVEDADGDGVIDSNDECPGEAGELSNGCPNTPPMVSVDAPDTVEDEVEFTVSASATDPDNQELSYEWSNGETGRSATYLYARSGVERELSVTVSDGLDSVTESATVQVVDGSNPPDSGSDGTDSDSNQGGLVSVLLEILSILPLVSLG